MTMTLGQRIARYRKALGLSQEELADRVGVSRQAVSKWELDETQPDADNIVRLAQALGASTDELLLGAQPPQPEPQPAAPAAEQSWPRALGGFVKKHGYKAGYLLIAYGAGLLLTAVVMFAVIHSFFSAADGMLSPGWGEGDMPIQWSSGSDLSPGHHPELHHSVFGGGVCW